MAISTNKNILITPGLGGVTSNAVSQIDFKWSETGVGTFIFNRTSSDLRASIYNWYNGTEPVLLFGGMGTLSAIQYNVSPYKDYSGSFSGITQFPTIQIYPISGKIFAYTLLLGGSIYDNNVNPGLYGQLLMSTGNGIAWTSSSSGSGGSINGTIGSNQVAFGSPQLNTIQGSNNLWFDGFSLGIGTSSLLQTLTVKGNTIFFGYATASGHFGPGTYLTNLNASNLASGTVPSSVVSGSYSGITSVGNLTQLNVIGIATALTLVGDGANITDLNATNLLQGIVPSSVISGSYSGITSVGNLTQLNVIGLTTVSQLRIVNQLFDSSAFGGAPGQYLTVTGSGIGWATASAVSGITGSGTTNALAKFNNPSSVTNSNISDSGTLVTISSPVNITGITTSIGWFGPGTYLTNLNASNLASGTVPSSVVSGSYSGITSVGNLTQLNVIGIATALTLVGDGANITDLNATNLLQGIVPSSVISGSYSGITSVGNLTQLNVLGVTTTLNLNSLGLSTINSLVIQKQLYDVMSTPGATGQVLVSLGTSVSWMTASSGGVTGSGTINSVPKFTAGTVLGNSNIVDIGIAITMTGGVVITGLTTALGWFGPGTYISNITATNIITGTLPSSVVSGSYSGITSVGNLTSLNVTGITTLVATRHVGLVLDAGYNAGIQSGLQNSFLMSIGTTVTWSPVKRSLVSQLITGYTPTGIGTDSNKFIVPYDPIDGATIMNFNLKRFVVRVETASVGITTINLMKHTQTGAFIGTAALTSNLSLVGIGSFEVYSAAFTGFGATATSNDKFAVNFIGLSATHQNFTCELIMREI